MHIQVFNRDNEILENNIYCNKIHLLKETIFVFNNRTLISEIYMYILCVLFPCPSVFYD